MLTSGQSITLPARIQTDAKTSAVVSFPGGTQSIISGNTDLEIEKPKNGTQWNKLHSGFVRTEVAKSKAAKSTGKFLFGFRTKAAVMGVRGTVFDIEESPAQKKTELKTLEGDVQVAKDEKTLSSGKGMSVTESQALAVNAGKIESPIAFNKEDYLDKLQNLRPDLMKLSETTLSTEAQSILNITKQAVPTVTLPAVTVPPVTAPVVTLPPAPAKPKLPF